MTLVKEVPEGTYQPPFDPSPLAPAPDLPKTGLELIEARIAQLKSSIRLTKAQQEELAKLSLGMVVRKKVISLLEAKPTVLDGPNALPSHKGILGTDFAITANRRGGVLRSVEVQVINFGNDGPWLRRSASLRRIRFFDDPNPATHLIMQLDDNVPDTFGDSVAAPDRKVEDHWSYRPARPDFAQNMLNGAGLTSEPVIRRS